MRRRGDVSAQVRTNIPDYTHKHSTENYTIRVSTTTQSITNRCYDGDQWLYNECRATACYKKISNDEYVHNPNDEYCNGVPCFSTEDELIKYISTHLIDCYGWGGHGD